MARGAHQPPRQQKGLYVQKPFAEALEDIVFIQKRKKGLTAPEVAELAIMLLCEHFDHDTTTLPDVKRG